VQSATDPSQIQEKHSNKEKTSQKSRTKQSSYIKQTNKQKTSMQKREGARETRHERALQQHLGTKKPESMTTQKSNM